MNDAATTLLAQAREELIRADSKASLLLASTGVALGALMAGLIAKSWSPTVLDHRIEWLWWVGIVSAATALILLARAVYPKTLASPSRNPAIVAYYGDIIGIDRTKLPALIQATESEIVYDQLYEVSKIVNSKYTSIRRALWSLGLAASSTIAALLVNRWLS